MLQLLVFPFSLPSSQMIFLKNITVFKNYFFNVEKIWKSYWTAVGYSASPSSQWADGWTTHRTKDEAGKSPCACCALPKLSQPSSHRQPFPSTGCLLLLPSAERGLPRKEKLFQRAMVQEGLRSWGQWWWVRGTLLRQPGMGWESVVAHGEAEVPLTLYFMRPQLSGSPPACLSLRQSWSPVRKKALIQIERQNRPAVLDIKGLRTVGFQKQI